jgi:hypothetical protein
MGADDRIATAEGMRGSEDGLFAQEAMHGRFRGLLLNTTSNDKEAKGKSAVEVIQLVGQILDIERLVELRGELVRRTHQALRLVRVFRGKRMDKATLEAKRCREAGVMPSMGSVGDAYDNAMAESFFASLERELLNRRRIRSQAEARMAVFEWIEGWYNPHRRHSSLGYRSPVNYERAHERSDQKNQSFCRLPAADRAAL